MNKSGNEIKELSIIILSYNTSSLTCETVESIFKTTKIDEKDFEIIVFDNNSLDDTEKNIKKIQQQHSNLIFIKSNQNLGFSRGNNQAVKTAKGKYLLFLNSDIIVHQKAIEILLTFAKMQNYDFFAGGKLLNEDQTPQPSCGPFYSLPVIFGALFLRGDYWGLTRYSPNITRMVDWASGACLLTKKATFEKLCGFDEKIFMYMEEIDLLYRARQKGVKTFFIHNAVFTHLVSASSSGKSYTIIQVYKGFSYFYKKHHGIFSQMIMRSMLQFKAWLVILIASILGKKSLAKTYVDAKKNITLG